MKLKFFNIKLGFILLMFLVSITIISCAKEDVFVESKDINDENTVSESDSSVSEEFTSDDISDVVENSDYVIGGEGKLFKLSLSGTGAKSEKFTIYDGESESSLLDDTQLECKIHCFSYHSYLPTDFLKNISNDSIEIFVKKYWKSNKIINGHSPVCEGYNEIQMMWDLGVTSETILANQFNEYGADIINSNFTKEQQEILFLDKDKITDDDLDKLQMAFKNDFCVYTNKSFYTLDWLNEHNAEDYLEQKLPIDQLEEMYSQKDSGYSFVEFLGERIEKYKSLLYDESK